MHNLEISPVHSVSGMRYFKQTEPINNIKNVAFQDTSTIIYIMRQKDKSQR